ncbi:MAG: hypothetical protein FWE94_07105 [Coriobacteriia bacterium]|nr:hypothetical protein [Coriobacteriia bacterium]
MGMRKHRIACLLVLLALCLSACSSVPDDTSGQEGSLGQAAPEVPLAQSGDFWNPPPAPPDVIESIDPAIREVICSEREFLCTETGMPVYLKDFRSGNHLSIKDNGPYRYTTGSEPTVDYFEGGGPPDYAQFCVADMDGDGALELLLSPPNQATSDNVLVLRYEDGVVYGFVFPCRGMGGVKTDGSFMCSGGSGHTEVSKVRFAKGRVIRDELCIVDAYTGEYRIGGQNVSSAQAWVYLAAWDDMFRGTDQDFSEEEVEAYLAANGAKQDVVWYAYDEAGFRE